MAGIIDVAIHCNSTYNIVGLLIVCFTLIVLGCITYKIICVIAASVLEYRNVEFKLGTDRINVYTDLHR